MHQKLGVNVFIADNNFEVVERADIVALCTDSREPIYTPEMLDAQNDGGLVIRCRIDEIDEIVFSKVDRIVGMSQDSMQNYEIGSEQEKKRRHWVSLISGVIRKMIGLYLQTSLQGKRLAEATKTRRYFLITIQLVFNSRRLDD